MSLPKSAGEPASTVPAPTRLALLGTLPRSREGTERGPR
jgi:hypothetical protein